MSAVGWMWKRPDGSLMLWTLERTKANCIAKAPLLAYQKKTNRHECVPVIITEAKPKTRRKKLTP